MINLKDDDLRPGSILLITATVGLALGLVFAVWLQYGKGFSTTQAIKAERLKQRTAREALKNANDRQETANEDLDGVLWKTSAEEATRLTHLQITKLSDQNKLKLVAFRPLRNAESDKIVQMPWQVLVEGSYPSVLAFEHDIERTAPKVSVNLVQLAADQEGTDKVTATVGLVGYLDKASLKKAATDKKPADDKKSGAK